MARSSLSSTGNGSGGSHSRGRADLRLAARLRACDGSVTHKQAAYRPCGKKSVEDSRFIKPEFLLERKKHGGKHSGRAGCRRGDDNAHRGVALGHGLR